jgi:hypothetical protein
MGREITRQCVVYLPEIAFSSSVNTFGRFTVFYFLTLTGFKRFSYKLALYRCMHKT